MATITRQVTTAQVSSAMSFLALLGHRDSTAGEIAACIPGASAGDVSEELERLEGSVVRWSDLLGGWELI